MTQEVQSEDKRKTKRSWILFLLTTAILVYMMIFVSEFFWVALPFSLTYFVWSMKVI